MLSDLNDFAHNQRQHLKLSRLFTTGAMFPILAYASDGHSLGLVFVAVAVTGYVVSIVGST